MITLPLPAQPGSHRRPRAAAPAAVRADVPTGPLGTRGRLSPGAISPVDGALPGPHRPDGCLWGGAVEFGAISFQLGLGQLATADTEVLTRRHPQGILASHPALERQKILALSWSDGGSAPIILTRMGSGTTSRNPSDL